MTEPLRTGILGAARIARDAIGIPARTRGHELAPHVQTAHPGSTA